MRVIEVTADYTNLIASTDYQEFLRYDGSDQSNIVPGLVESAIRQAEAYCNATFGDKTYEVYFDDVCAGKWYRLPYGPIQSVDAVSELTAVDGDVPTASAITTGFNISPTKDEIKFHLTGDYKVEYTAGIATPANVNEQVKEAILKILSENFDDRESV